MTIDLTDELALPSPQSNEEATVHTDLKALADRLELLLAAGHVALWSPGDFKVSAKTTSHGRWLLCDGTEKTAAEIVTACGLDAGDADALVTLLGTGATSIYGTAAVGKVQLPDPRDRTLMAVGGTYARGASAGAAAVTLSAVQSGLPAHSHAADQPAHSHEYPHNHAIVFDTHNDLTGGGSRTAIKDIGSGPGNDSTEANFVDTTETADPAVTTDPATAQAAASSHENMPPYLALGHVFIRV